MNRETDKKREKQKVEAILRGRGGAKRRKRGICRERTKGTRRMDEAKALRDVGVVTGNHRYDAVQSTVRPAQFGSLAANRSEGNRALSMSCPVG